MRDGDSLRLPGGSRREVVELKVEDDLANMKYFALRKMFTAILVLASSSAKNDSLKRGSGYKQLPSSASSSRVW